MRIEVGNLRFSDLKPGDRFVFAHKNNLWKEEIWYIKDPCGGPTRYYRGTLKSPYLSETLYAAAEREVIPAEKLPWYENIAPCHDKKPIHPWRGGHCHSHGELSLWDDSLVDLIAIARRSQRVDFINACQGDPDPWIIVGSTDDAGFILRLMGDSRHLAETTAVVYEVGIKTHFDIEVGIKIMFPTKILDVLKQELSTLPAWYDRYDFDFGELSES